MLSFDAVEDVCESKHTTLVIHPIIRRAVKGYEESFDVGLRCYLAGETGRSSHFLPLPGGRRRAPVVFEARLVQR